MSPNRFSFRHRPVWAKLGALMPMGQPFATVDGPCVVRKRLVITEVRGPQLMTNGGRWLLIAEPVGQSDGGTVGQSDSETGGLPTP